MILNIKLRYIYFSIPHSTCINMVGNILSMIYLRNYQGSELESFVIRIKWAWIGFFSELTFWLLCTYIVVDMIDLNFCIWCGIDWLYIGTFYYSSINYQHVVIFIWFNSIHVKPQLKSFICKNCYWIQIGIRTIAFINFK